MHSGHRLCFPTVNPFKQPGWAFLDEISQIKQSQMSLQLFWLWPQTHSNSMDAGIVVMTKVGMLHLH